MINEEERRRNERSWNDVPIFRYEQLNKQPISSVPLNRRYKYSTADQQQVLYNQMHQQQCYMNNNLMKIQNGGFSNQYGQKLSLTYNQAHQMNPTTYQQQTGLQQATNYGTCNQKTALGSNRLHSNRLHGLNRSNNSNRSFGLNQYQNYPFNKQNNALNKQNGSLNHLSISQKITPATIKNLIEKCFDQLNELKKERMSLLFKNNLDSINLSSTANQLNLEDILNFAVKECDEIGKWFKENGELLIASNENFQTIDCSFNCWFNQIQAVKYLLKREFVELNLNQIGMYSVINSSLANSSFESGSSSIQSSVAGSIQSSVVSNDLQLYGQLQQLIKSTRDVRKSLWCIAVLYSNEVKQNESS